MCTYISEKIKIEGSGKGSAGWFKQGQVASSYDHPFDAPYEHALNLDFINEDLGPGARVAVELSESTARDLIKTIQAVLDQAAAGNHLDSQRQQLPMS